MRKITNWYWYRLACWLGIAALLIALWETKEHPFENKNVKIECTNEN